MFNTCIEYICWSKLVTTSLLTFKAWFGILSIPVDFQFLSLDKALYNLFGLTVLKVNLFQVLEHFLFSVSSISLASFSPILTK